MTKKRQKRIRLYQHNRNVFINNPFVQSKAMKKVENIKIFEKHLRIMNFTVNYIYS